MTISSTSNRKSFSGDGVTDSFGTSPVVFYETSNLQVYVITDATGAENLLTENTHYTVTGGDGSTGTVDLSGGSSPYGAPSADESLVILRVLPYTQTDDFVNNSSSDAEVVETRFDRTTLMIQQLAEEQDRVVKLSPAETGTASLTELPFDRASQFLAFDANKVPIAAAGTTEVPVSTFMETLLDDTTAAAGRTTLDASKTEPLDSVFRVVGSADATKKLAFEVDGISASTVRTASVPDYNVRMSNMPAGIGPLPYAGASVPTGWLECDGSAVSRSTYAALYTAIGDTWGDGDGSTTFNLPDMRGKSPIGAGTGTVVATGDTDDVDTGADTLTVASNNTKWVTGMAVEFTLASGTITGLTSGNTYYVIRDSSTTVQLASTLANAQNGTAVNMTGKSSPEWTITHTYTARALGEYGGEEAHAMSSTELLSHDHRARTADAVNGAAADGAVTRSSAAIAFQNFDTLENTGGNAAMNIMNPFAVVKYIISY